MDIKRLFNFPTINPIKRPDRANKLAKFDPAQERDANGQEAYQQPKSQQHEPMNDEQFEKALEDLRQLPAVKEHHWQVSALVENGKRFALLCDETGKLIRRIPELDLWTVTVPNESTKGQFLKRTA